ncbi:MAG: electron transfer flavoprotein subunit alpha/FixB family protein [Spirochaeta sp.]|jgi:electron transfer flavoprotein alpha subunit|nr:electron transfer flavoprotein subunit alpha/FixB family protein [Spirochaeta sp.]
MNNALIYIDPDNAHASLELTGVLDRMYGPDTYTVYGLYIGENAPDGASGGDRFLDGAVDGILRVPDETVSPYDAAGVAACIAELHDTYRFTAVLFLATTFGRSTAPRTAMRLHTGLVADVTEIRHDGDRIHLVRPAFSGRMLAAVVCRGGGPIMLTVRQNTFVHDGSRRRKTETITAAPHNLRPPRLRLVKRRTKDESYDIRESDVLVSGGGGVMRNFDDLETLASHLHAMVSASRRVVDSGKAPRYIQVGQSGKTVSPRLYIAVGISGSIQHIVGLKNAEYIIAVNTDRTAPICSRADIVVEGDARTFIPRLVERIKRNGTVPPEPHDTTEPTPTDHGGDA